MTEPTDLEPITALLPAPLLVELRALAKTNERSIAGELRVAVRAHVERERAAA